MKKPGLNPSPGGLEGGCLLGSTALPLGVDRLGFLIQPDPRRGAGVGGGVGGSVAICVALPSPEQPTKCSLKRATGWRWLQASCSFLVSEDVEHKDSSDRHLASDVFASPNHLSSS